MLLSHDERDRLAEVFNIERTGVSEIRDSQVVRDGRSDENLEAITLEKMNAYIGSEETFARAWELTCAKVRSELNPPIGIIQAKTVPTEMITEEMRKAGVDETTPLVTREEVVKDLGEEQVAIIESNVKINENTSKKSK